MSKRPKGFFKGAEAEARTQGKAMSPGTSASYTPGAGHRTGGNGATTTTKGTVSTQKKTGVITSAIGFATGIEPLKWAGRLIGLGKKKTEKQKSESYTKKGFDILNPNEMKVATKPIQPPDGGNGGDGMAQITLNTQSVASTAIPETKSGWGFKAYQPGTTANTRLYGKKGKMIKANQGEFSQGKRFGPPPTKGPDPQGINVPLNSIDYFKDLL